MGSANNKIKLGAGVGVDLSHLRVFGGEWAAVRAPTVRELFASDGGLSLVAKVASCSCFR